MPKLSRQIGSTSQILEIFIRDSSSTTGAGLTGLTSGSSGLTAYYSRNTAASTTAISLTSMTGGTFTSSGFVERDAVNMPGVYQLCPPNACFASGASSVFIMLKGATNMAPLPIEIDLDAQVTLSDGVAHGGTLGSSTATFAMSRVNFTSQTADTTAFTILGNGTGNGLSATGGSTGNGWVAAGGSLGGSGIRAAATLVNTAAIIASSGSGPGISVFAGGSNNGIETSGSGSGMGFQSTGGDTGHGARFTGGASSGSGFVITATASGGNGILVTGVDNDAIRANGGTNSAGFRSVGNGSGAGVRFDGGSSSGSGVRTTGGGTGHGILSTSGSGATGDGARFVAASTDGNGLFLDGTGTGSGLIADSWTISGTTTFTGAWTASNAGNNVNIGTTSGVKLADGVTHGGTTAKMRLGTSTTTPAFLVTSSAVGGAAVNFQSTGTESIAFLVEGQNADSFGMSIVADAGVGLGIVGLNHGIYVEANQDVTLGGSGTITGQIFTATSLATFFTIDSGQTAATAVAGSVVKEINAGTGTLMIDSTYNLAQYIKAIGATTAGAESAGPGTANYRTLDGLVVAVAGTATTDGNRSAITYNL